jgi:hypothetical protein
MSSVLNIHHSVLEQAWHWRGSGTDSRDPDFQPDDLVTQLLMARGVPRDDIERQRNPTIRNFMPDPSIFQDMEMRHFDWRRLWRQGSKSLSMAIMMSMARPARLYSSACYVCWALMPVTTSPIA